MPIAFSGHLRQRTSWTVSSGTLSYYSLSSCPSTKLTVPSPASVLSPSFIQTLSFRTSQPSSSSQQQRPNQQYQQQPQSTFDVSSLAHALQQSSSSSPATTSAGWASSFLQQQGQQLGRSMDQRQRDEMNRVYQSVRRGGAEGSESLVWESDDADDRAHRPLPPVRLWQVSIGGTTFYTLNETTQQFSCFLRIM